MVSPSELQPAARPLPADGAESFPSAYAKTRRFSVGLPRNITITGDGRVLFLRSRNGTDPVLCLWQLDPTTRDESLLVDPAEALSVEDEELPAAERARRERARESAAGIVSYAVDNSGRRACFSLGGSLFVVALETGRLTRLSGPRAVFDPRLSPDGNRILYVSGDELRLAELDDDGGDAVGDRSLISPTEPDVGFGRAEFIAAEEMQRSRGYWWSPRSDQVLVVRVDESLVNRWWIADPALPGQAPNEVRYPVAGSANAQVGLFLVDLDGERREIDWDENGRFEYLADVLWPSDHNPLLVRQTRHQREVSITELDPATLSLTERRTINDDIWVELHPGSPTVCDHGLLTVEDVIPSPAVAGPAATGHRALVLDGQPITDGSFNVRSIVGAIGDHAVVTAWTEPSEIHLFLIDLTGGGDALQLTTTPGVHSAAIGAVAGGDDDRTGGESGDGDGQSGDGDGQSGDDPVVTVVTAARPTADGVEVVLRPLLLPGRTSGLRADRGLGGPLAFIEDLSDRPPIKAVPTFCQLGADRLESALFLPAGYDGEQPLPVLLDPYGGPHAQRVLKTQTAHLVSQWFADQGFAVLVTDGRGTPGRGPEWERQVWGDLATPVLEDQLAALDDAADEFGVLDLQRVAIRGWSFGGYLAALAVLRRPDRFHCAVAGAPVTDWRLYDTHYTERYLGRPDLHPGHYNATDLTAEADQLTRPLLLIHGLADDNVVAAHTLRLSTALLAAAAPHQVLPLSGVTHMTPQEAVAENLLWLQLDFIRRSLGIQLPGARRADNPAMTGGTGETG